MRATKHRIRGYSAFSNTLDVCVPLISTRAVGQMPLLFRRKVLVIDYRGFGDSTGKPIEAGLLLDAHAAWDYVASHSTKQASLASDTILVGQSLGTGVVSALAGSLAQESKRTGHPESATNSRRLSPRARIDRAILVSTRAAARLHTVLGDTAAQAAEGVPSSAE